MERDTRHMLTLWHKKAPFAHGMVRLYDGRWSGEVNVLSEGRQERVLGMSSREGIVLYAATVPFTNRVYVFKGSSGEGLVYEVELPYRQGGLIFGEEFSTDHLKKPLSTAKIHFRRPRPGEISSLR